MAREEAGKGMRFSWRFEVSSAKLAYLPAGCGECASVSGEGAERLLPFSFVHIAK